MFHLPARPARRGGAVDDVLDLAEEVRGAARFGLGGAPVVAGHQQGVLGAGDRDVEKPAFLVDASLLELIAVGDDAVGQSLPVADRRGVQHRHPVQSPGCAVAAQQRRQVGGVGQPGALGRRGREHPGGQMRHGHHLPLQALGRVHGEDLHAVLRDADVGGREAVLDDRRGLQVRQQSVDGRSGPARVVGDDVGEPVQVLGPGPAGGDRPRRAHLDVDPENSPDLGDQVGDRVAQKRSQSGQFGGQFGDAEVAVVRVGAGRTGIGQRVGQAGGVGVGSRRGDDLLGGRRHRPLTVEGDRAAPQRGDVAGAQPPARPGQHPHGRRACGGVGDQAQHRHQVGDLRDRQQPGQPDHFDRDAARAQRLGHRSGVGIAPNQHGGSGRRAARGGGLEVAGGDVVGHPVPFGGDVGQQRAL